MEGIIDVSSSFVFEGSGDSDDHKTDFIEDDGPFVAIFMNVAAVDDAESVLGFDDDDDDDEEFILGFDGDDQFRDSIDDRRWSRLGDGFVERDPVEEEEEVNSGGVGRREMMENMENKLFWETCLLRGYP